MARELVNIKGTREGLVIFFEPNIEFEEIKTNLERKIRSAKEFFRGAEFTVHQADKSFSSNQCNELVDICRYYGLIPSKDIRWPLPISRVIAKNADEPARLVFCTLRSGQEVYHQNSIVIIGDVHPGAQVNAGGNIIIIGKCRGNVNAGVSDNSKATITALHLIPGRLTIAGIENRQTRVYKDIPGPKIARLNNNKIEIQPYFRNTVS